ncbi:MAG TPA: OmpA family protein [Flavobacterium sp.]|nr:OmpA family protein [Flavobacterium sp.]
MTAFCFTAHAQEVKEKKADTKYENSAYIDAISIYTKLADKGYASEELLTKLGNSHYFTANYEEAAKWYGQLFDMAESDIDTEIYFRYAQSLKSIGEYDKSDEYMKKFHQLKKEDSRGQMFNDNQSYLNDIEELPQRFFYQLADFNTSYSDFGVAFYNQQIVFSSAKPVRGPFKDENTWDGQPFFNLFTVNENGKNDYFQIEKNRFHTANAVFTKDGRFVYFTQSFKVKAQELEDVVYKDQTILKIYKAENVDGKWTNVEELPFNSDAYSCTHPALSPDETALYFSSNMPGTVGQSDIYKVSITANHTVFGQPMNLGKPVNTEGRESFPFVSADNRLYFSSDGHLGLGGLDFFQFKLSEDDAVVENLGKGINSPYDDFSIYINEDLKTGFFSSNRPDGIGRDDIYMITDIISDEEPYYQIFEGIVQDKETFENIPDARVSIFNDNFDLLTSGTTQPDGTFSNLTLEDVNPGDIVFVRAEHADYNTEETSVILPEESGVQSRTIYLEKKVVEVKEGDDLAKIFEIENVIYFEFDKSEINKEAEVELAKVLEVLNLYPTMKLDVRSHTDSRGTHEYNQNLSDHRAKATIDWLVAHGVEQSRLTGRGYGETNLINECADGVDCSEEQHQENRRSEFIITEL